MIEEAIQFRWLGVAGIELSTEEEVLAIDPFFSRPPFRRMWFGRVIPDRPLVAAKLPRCDFVLITHAHWDHLMDVPEVLRNTGAVALGSPNSCRLLSILGVPEDQIHPIQSGEEFPLGEFLIQVFPARHGTAFGRPVFSGLLPHDLHPPLRVRDYRMDVNFSFLIEAGGYRLLDWNSEDPEPAVQADVLFVGPQRKPGYYDALLRQVRPRIVIPIHWDDFFRPLSRPLRPLFTPPNWTLPPLHYMRLAEFKHTLRKVAPTARVFLPELFQSYKLDHLT